MNVREITVPVTKPATEWVNGRALQKSGQPFPEALAQAKMGAALGAWAEKTGSGRAGLEWDFRVTPPGEPTRPLVADLSFLSYDRLAYERDEAAQIPYMAPDAAIEILSPRDEPRDIEEKVRVYLAAGARLVLLIDPVERAFIARDTEGARRFSGDDIFTHRALPDFSMRVSSIFELPKPKR